MDLGLEGSNALVTASSQGLGRAVAARLATEGARVAISSRSEENLETAKERIVADTGVDADQIVPVVCDLSESETVPDRIAVAVDELDGLDVLVTNHGGPPAVSFEEATVEDFDETYASLVKSTILTVETALPHLRSSGGSITNIVSASAREPPTNHVLSNTLRPAIYGLSKSLANEYADDGVRVNCVCPRSVMTDRIEYKIDVLADNEDITVAEAHNRREEELPLRRLGDPKEFARAVAFVASDAASFITGAVLRVDGGWAKSAF